MSTETNSGSIENDPIKRFFNWKEASGVEINAMSPEQLKAFLTDLNGKVNQIYDVLMFPVNHERPATDEEVDVLLNPQRLADSEEIDRFVDGDPEA